MKSPPSTRMLAQTNHISTSFTSTLKTVILIPDFSGEFVESKGTRGMLRTSIDSVRFKKNLESLTCKSKQCSIVYDDISSITTTLIILPPLLLPWYSALVKLLPITRITSNALRHGFSLWLTLGLWIRHSAMR